MIKKTESLIPGLFVLRGSVFNDARGSFKKVFSKEAFEELSLECDFAELYYSINNKNVIRGMHFQIPPEDHAKMVYCTSGKILDVCLDLRKASPTYRKYASWTLCGNDEDYLYIPKGIAHGFASLEDNTIVHYAQTSCYSERHDCGVRYDSFGFSWNINEPVLSSRDKAFRSLVDFESPF